MPETNLKLTIDLITDYFQYIPQFPETAIFLNIVLYQSTFVNAFDIIYHF